MNELSNQLRAVYTVVDELGWTQGSYGISGNGSLRVWATHPSARGFCLAGAIELVGAHLALTSGERHELYWIIEQTLELDGGDVFAIEHWNDAPTRTKADVLHALDTAIELLDVADRLGIDLSGR